MSFSSYHIHKVSSLASTDKALPDTPTDDSRTDLPHEIIPEILHFNHQQNNKIVALPPANRQEATVPSVSVQSPLDGLIDPEVLAKMQDEDELEDSTQDRERLLSIKTFHLPDTASMPQSSLTLNSRTSFSIQNIPPHSLDAQETDPTKENENTTGNNIIELKPRKKKVRFQLEKESENADDILQKLLQDSPVPDRIQPDFEDEYHLRHEEREAELKCTEMVDINHPLTDEDFSPRSKKSNVVTSTGARDVPFESLRKEGRSVSLKVWSSVKGFFGKSGEI